MCAECERFRKELLVSQDVTRPDVGYAVSLAPSQAMIDLARKAVAAMRERKHEDIEMWARRLAEDISRFND